MRGKFSFSWVALIFASLLLFSVSSCKDDDETSSGSHAGTYHYHLNVANANDEVLVVLDSISTAVSSVSATPEWATVTILDSTVNGHPVLKLTLTQGDPNTSDNGDVVVYSVNQDKVILTLNRGYYYYNDNNSGNDEFSTNWENMSSVNVFYGNSVHEVNLPWAESVKASIPDKIRKDVKQADGWEMAFNTLNVSGLDDCNYFALYNRYLGTFRVFYYVTNSITDGSEFSFETNLGSSGSSTNKTPFYHALAYAIPNNHTTVANNVNLIEGISTFTTFKGFYTPYTTSSSTSLSQGWLAFDIPATAYCPMNQWKKSSEGINLSCRTLSKESISLNGTLEANLSGKFNDVTAVSTDASTSSSNGITSMLSSLGNFAGSDFVKSIVGKLMGEKSAPLKAADYVSKVSSAFNIACSVIDYALENEFEEKAVVDSMPGRIEMSLTGDIKLSGYISKLTSNSVSPLTIQASQFSKTTHFGEGVWNLAEDPVIYVADDLFMGDAKRITLNVSNSDKTYRNNDLPDYHLRTISFLDPTSVKLLINTNEDVFDDISDVDVYCDYGVYTGIEKGYTSKYVSLLGLSRPTVDIIKTSESKTIYQSLSDDNKTKYLCLPHTQFMSELYGETESNCSLIKQTGTTSDFYYYGKLSNDDNKVIMQPQVYFNYSSGDSIKMYNAEVPDYVVFVNVSFKSKGKTYLFSQRFLPKVVAISSSELEKKYNELQKYADNCEQGVAINNLENNLNVEVRHSAGKETIQKTLDILNAVVNYDK